MNSLSVPDTAALLRIAIDEKTMSRLYRIGVVRPDNEVEDLCSALSFLAEIVVKHGLRLSR